MYARTYTRLEASDWSVLSSFRLFGRHKIAQEQLGHASISTTLNVYTHVVDASHRSAVEAVEGRLFVDLDPNGLETAGALESDPRKLTELTRFGIGAPPGFEPGIEVLQIS